jgi:hypothetical protein
MEKKGTLPTRSERRRTNAGLAGQNSKIAKAHFEFKAHEEHYFVCEIFCPYLCKFP